jgi:NAD+ diphosphatase
MSQPITFSGSPMDRAALQRRDPSWVKGLLEDDSARFLPLWKLDPLVKLGEDRSLAWATRAMLEDAPDAPAPVLLGIHDGAPHFALDISSLEEPLQTLGFEGAATFEDLRAIAPQLRQGEPAIAAQARSITDWHARHGYCAVCSAKTVPEEGGGHRRCPDCAAQHFPRTDPVAIAAIGRGERCLLGRGPGWPPTMFSALAGFLEPGETIEEAVRREVAEESSVRVGEVRYVLSQPWPFPSSLMIGCIGEAESEDIEVDHAELEDARWFSLEEIRNALDGKPGPLFVPPPFAVAHYIIKACAASFS